MCNESKMDSFVKLLSSLGSMFPNKHSVIKRLVQQETPSPAASGSSDDSARKIMETQALENLQNLSYQDLFILFDSGTFFERLRHNT